LKECSQVHKNYENLEASKHNLWAECEGYMKCLKFEIEFLRETLSKFVGSTEKLNKILRYNKCPTDKYRNGYKGKKYVHDKETIVCYFCGKIGHMTSKCRHLPKIGLSNAFKTNKKRLDKSWVPKEKIIFVADIFNHDKDTPIMVLGQWLLTSYDRTKRYVPMLDSHAWWNSHFQTKLEREDSRSGKDKY